MAVASITRLKKRIVAILLAAPRTDPYGGTVLNNAGLPATGRYPDDQEITDAILEGDARTCTAIIETIGHPYRPQFFTTSGSLANGDSVPAHVGKDALIKVDGVPARLAKNMNQMLEVIANPAMYPVASKWAYLEDATLLHNGTIATISYPNFTMTTLCQAPEAYESADLCNAISLLAKDGAASDYYSYYTELAVRQEAAIRAQELVISDIEQIARVA